MPAESSPTGQRNCSADPSEYLNEGRPAYFRGLSAGTGTPRSSAHQAMRDMTNVEGRKPEGARRSAPPKLAKAPLRASMVRLQSAFPFSARWRS
jgi:hypothetical protein